MYKIPCTFWGWGVLFLLLRLSETRKRLVMLKEVWRGQNWFGILKITHSAEFKDSFLSAAEKSCWWPTSSQRCRAWRYGVRRVSWVIWRQGRWWKQHKLHLRNAASNIWFMVLYLTDHIQLITLGVVRSTEGQVTNCSFPRSEKTIFWIDQHNLNKGWSLHYYLV